MTGFLRTFRQSLPFLEKSVLGQHDVDFFLTTWNKDEEGNYIADDFYKPFLSYNLEKIVVKDIDVYNATKHVIKKINRSNDIFDIDARAKEHGEYWANRLKDQWFLVKTAFEEIEEPKNYDLIFRTRFDLFLENIQFYKDNCLIIPRDIGGWSYTDHMAYGNVEVMNKYCHLHDHIYNLYELHNIDITHAVNMPKFYIENYQTTVETRIDNSIKYFIKKV
jgi:hypothetical protein